MVDHEIQSAWMADFGIISYKFVLYGVNYLIDYNNKLLLQVKYPEISVVRLIIQRFFIINRNYLFTFSCKTPV